LGKVSKGFTLIELALVTGLVAIGTAFAVPGLHSLMTYGRRASEINRLHRDLDYARSEAILRGTVVALCTSHGSVCSNDSDWDGGWIVFVDGNGNLKRDGGEKILRSVPAFSDGNRLTGNRLVAHRLGYRREGFLKGLHNGTITFSATPDRKALRRCLVISRTGRIRTETGNDSHCAAQNP
jgi:type IV fimbrial biogenesis protein FimT